MIPFLRADENEISIWYCFYDKLFNHEKQLIFLNKFLKVAKFDKKNWIINPVVDVC